MSKVISKNGINIPDFAATWVITKLPNNWGVCLKDVSPDEAKLMLAMNVDNQRKIIRSSINRMRYDISNGNWKLTHQGIAFNNRGQLHDGQNRLIAIAESGMVVPIIIFFGAGAEAEMLCFDGGKNRTLYDHSNVLGQPLCTGVPAIIQCLVANTITTNVSKLSSSVKLRYMNKYGEMAGVIQRWFDLCKINGLGIAPVKAAILAAMIHGVPVEVLNRFAFVLIDREINTTEEDSAARLLRAHLLGVRGGPSNRFLNREVFLRTCSAITHAIAGNKLTSLRKVSSCPFNVPND